ncbi:MAG: hypothetical protein WBE48_13290 [Xanthobacteraceae bacterium]|jgi:hypothetical protein
MDEVTQQNSALVEENTATAKTLEAQAVAMTEQVAVFRLDDGAQHEVAAPAVKASPRTAAPKPAAKPAVVTAATSKAASRMNGRGPVGRMQTALAAAIKDGPEWEEF